MQKKLVIKARAPLRIGIAGGGTDVDPYASEKGGLVFNTTIDKYAYCTLVPNDSNVMSVISPDYGVFKAPLDKGELSYDGNMDIFKAVTNHFGVKNGFDAYIYSDVPPGSGLGGSSTLMVAIIGAVTEWLGIKLKKYEMADLAYRLEREDIGLKGGKQDQYAAVFGGFNLMSFTKTGVKVKSLKLRESIIEELEERSLLCYTGKVRESADIIASQVSDLKSHVSSEEAYDESKKLAVRISKALQDGDINETGELLNLAWEQKKKFTAKVTNPTIDALYSTAIENGAIGGKVSGAGGGGFMYFICERGKKMDVAEKLRAQGAEISNFIFDSHGVKSEGMNVGRSTLDGIICKLGNHSENRPC